jgi:hypothetical protein
MPTIAIPSWLDEIAPGAAQAARSISDEENLSDLQRERLERLTSELTKPVWVELQRDHSSKEKLSKDKIIEAQHELMFVSFRAPDFLPISEKEVERSKNRLKELAGALKKLIGELREVSDNAQLPVMWGAYWKGRLYDPPFRLFSHDLPIVFEEMDRVADFYEVVAGPYKPAGPISPVKQVNDAEALKTTVIRHIAEICKKHFGTPMYRTVATLANATLNRTDITADTVRGSLR